LNTATLVSHHNICRLFDITVPEPGRSAAFISMELLEGRPWKPLKRAQWIFGSPSIISQVVNGLTRRTSGHRPSRPQAGNIMLTQQNGKLRVSS